VTKAIEKAKLLRGKKILDSMPEIADCSSDQKNSQ
jgi:hypothetical protein